MEGDLTDPGELTVDLQFASDVLPPINGASEAITITFADAETYAANGFMTGFTFTGEVEGLMTGTATEPGLLHVWWGTVDPTEPIVD